MSNDFPHRVYACAILFKKKEKDEAGRVSVCFHLEVVTARSEGEALEIVAGFIELPPDCDIIGTTATVIPDEVIADVAAQQKSAPIPASMRVN